MTDVAVSKVIYNKIGLKKIIPFPALSTVKHLTQNNEFASFHLACDHLSPGNKGGNNNVIVTDGPFIASYQFRSITFPLPPVISIRKT